VRDDLNLQSNDQVQGRLLTFAAVLVLIYAIALTLSPAARIRSWNVTFRWDHWLGILVWFGVFAFAHFHSSRFLPYRNPYILPIAGLLCGWGLMTIWRLYPTYGLRQTIWLGVVGGSFIFGLRLPSDLSYLRRYKYIWLTLGLLLTALTLFLGTNPLGYGPRMWLGCCGVYFQPSEPLKLLLVVYLSAYLADRLPSKHASSLKLGRSSQSSFISTRISLLPLLAPTLVMTGLAMALLIVQQDLGTASIFLFLYTITVYLATSQKRILVSGGIALLLASIVGYGLFDVVRLRVDAWLNPWVDPSGRSFQILQSLLAIANGGLFGRGPGLGNPALVPVPHSDFIFAAIAEESGLIGVIGLCLIIALFLNKGFQIALNAPDNFRRFLAAGLTVHIVAQSILISGGNLRLLPLTGVTLPFVSYGGSSLLTSFMSILLLIHISNRSEQTIAPEKTDLIPYLQVSTFLLIGIGLLVFVAGWWSVYRGPSLLARTDNPRRAITDRYVARGAILDRNNEAITGTFGSPGEYTRQILIPSLSPVVGYTNQVYGQSGIEAGLDGYLRGESGNTPLTIWWNHILYGQPPIGLDVRLSLDIRLQQIADQALLGHVGALVLLNAESGEILVMSTSPNFDANQLEDQWDRLVADPSAPFINRASQGAYPVQQVLASIFTDGSIPEPLLTQPLIRLPVGSPAQPSQPVLSPLQVTLGAAAISSGGVRPAARLALAVNTPQSGWVLLPVLDQPVEILPTEEATRIANQLKDGELSIWSSLVTESGADEKQYTWYVAGTTPNWDRFPIAIAVLLEENALEIAEHIGKTLLTETMMP